MVSQLASLAKWLSVRQWTKWLRVRIPLQSFKLQISHLLFAKKFLDIQVTTECRFTLKRVCDMIRRHGEMHHIDKCTQHRSIMASLTKWLSIPLRTKRLFGKSSSLTFRQLHIVDSLEKAYWHDKNTQMAHKGYCIR